jgi:hypothetical protein
MTIKIALPVVLEFEKAPKDVCKVAGLGDAKGTVYVVYMTIGDRTKLRGFLSHAEENVFAGNMDNMCFEVLSNLGNHMGTTTFNAQDLSAAASKIMECLLTYDEEVER